MLDHTLLQSVASLAPVCTEWLQDIEAMLLSAARTLRQMMQAVARWLRSPEMQKIFRSLARIMPKPLRRHPRSTKRARIYQKKMQPVCVQCI